MNFLVRERERERKKLDRGRNEGWEGIKLEFGIIIIDKCGLKSQIRRLITFLHIGKPFFIPKGNSIICPVACDVFYTTLDYRISIVPPSRILQYLRP